MEIRYARMSDLRALAAVEAECFPAAEAATEEALAGRLAVYPNHFWLLFDGDRLVSFVNGMVTDEADLSDEMYADPSLHREDGRWQMIFGVNTIPAFRRRGCAALLLERAIADAGTQGRSGLVLTCKERLIPYYGKFGFADEGVSASEHGGVIWHQMWMVL
ncbi:MAG: GNAT family N-acetyltransferase [Clostridiales bacterium]|nr:GNAT family N-acetyltransferase [Clostridiales bacterium]